MYEFVPAYFILAGCIADFADYNLEAQGFTTYMGCDLNLFVALDKH